MLSLHQTYHSNPNNPSSTVYSIIVTVISGGDVISGDVISGDVISGDAYYDSVKVNNWIDCYCVDKGT